VLRWYEVCIMELMESCGIEDCGGQGGD
jgi:hypothetical protein